MVFGAVLLSTQHYKVGMKSKVDQSWEWSCALPQHLGVVAIEKGALGSPTTKVDYIYIYIYMCVCIYIYSTIKLRLKLG